MTAFGAVFGTGSWRDACGGSRGVILPAERVLLVRHSSVGATAESKEAKRVAFSEYLEELKVFLQLIGENLVLTGPIDDDHPAVAGSEEARESQSLACRGVAKRRPKEKQVGGSILKKTVAIPSLPVHVPILGTSTFCLPEKQKRAVTCSGGARKINRRRLPVVCVRFPKPFQFLAHSAKNSKWRPTLKFARTIYDDDYTLNEDQLKLNVVYIESFSGAE